jgi:hypothetical protein
MLDKARFATISAVSSSRRRQKSGVLGAKLDDLPSEAAYAEAKGGARTLEKRIRRKGTLFS